MPAIILSQEATDLLKAERKKFEPYAEKGWLCEGGEHGDITCNVFFNNDTDEFFRADYNGNILYNALKGTSLSDAKEMAKIYGKIMTIR